jgi:hypothetical protein
MLSLRLPEPIHRLPPSLLRYPQSPMAPPNVKGNLPSELILDIFELGATSDKTTAISLLQLTSWSRKLLLPLLYECVALESWSRVDQLKQTLQSEHGAEIQESIKRLSLAVGEYPIIDILHACQSVTSLTVSSILFRKQSSFYTPPNAMYRPAIMSPHLTHLTIHGPTYIIHPRMIPPTVTHLVLKDDAPTVGYSLQAVTTLPNLTHLAFNVTQQLLPFAPDPSPRMILLLDALFSRGLPSESYSAGMPSVPGMSTILPSCSPLSLIAIKLSPGVDTRIVDTLLNYKYRSPGLRSSFPLRGEEDPESGNKTAWPRLNVFNELERQWWTQEEWATKAGEESFWKRMEEGNSV